ncbi:phage tail protein [Mesorhizobium sp.]|uniref:host specificity protein J n=1 Tax=Mesorhizobium sp. TaxID=1871066 RepID=UPI000FE40649|nr:phage tail protein [Mesorhizobium sp.]RWI35431.1 MAG: hypothetical protein EOR14_28430 [Mesorhizobium sp.]RWJ03529.1 MAG: hypothetical protein EOR24_32655 [Mesorhizobium sp.]
MNAITPDIRGAGGGSKKGGGKDASNTLQSRARARMVELISEGEIEGLVDGLKSIYFDQTPVVAQNGTVNLKGVIYEERTGTPDQPHINGSPYVETPIAVETEVTFDNGPVTRTIFEENADALRVIVRIPSLFKSTDDGMKTASVAYKVEVRPFGGAWTTAATKVLNKQKCVSPYQIAHRIELPAGGCPWDVRVVRLTEDSDDDKKQNETWWDSYVILVEGKFTYPNSALVFLDVDSEEFGSNVPARSFHVRGLKVHVPSNYDPFTRTYTGIWNGTFQVAWTNNPAWVFYDLIVNDRYGLGEFVDIARVDKWGLYRIAQYCDEMVFTGFRDINGDKTYEPRFQFNGVINSRKEAYDVLRDIASAFRGMAFWSLGQIFAVADIPADPVKLVSPANVIGGAFKYSGTGMAARHSVALVSWNNPSDFYRPAVEPVISDEALRKWGWRDTPYQAVGCTSRGQAHRLGRWILDVEQNENETVEYTCSFDHMDVRPFDIIQIADPRKAQFRNGGRIAGVNPDRTIVTLDAPVSFVAEESHVFSVELPDGSVVSKTVIAFQEVTDGKAGKVVLDTALSDTPVTGAMWVIGSLSAQPRQYRVLTVQETDKHLFRVTALFHDPNKYVRVEDETDLEPIRYTRPRDSIAKVINPLAVQTTYFQNGVAQTKLILSWTPGDDFMAARYSVTADTPDGPVDYGQTSLTTIEIDNAAPGEWSFFIVAVGYNGLRSDALQYDFVTTGWEATVAPSITGLTLVNGNAGEFVGGDAEIAWTNNFAGAPADAGNPFYRRNTVDVYDAGVVPNVLLRSEVSLTPSYVYSLDKNAADAAELSRPLARKLRFDVTLTDTMDRVSGVATLTVENPAPATPVVSVQAGFEQIFISWSGATDTDYAGTLVWVEAGPGFDPATTEPVFRGTGGAFSYHAGDAIPYYIRVGHYDRFALFPANISSEVSVTPSDLEVDTTPPDVPAGLTLSSRIETIEGVDQRVILTAGWTAATASDFAYYEIQIKENTGNYVGLQTGINRHEWTVLPGQVFTAKLRAVDAFGNASAYCEPVTHTAGVDTIPPAVPTGLTAIPGFELLWLKWNKNTETDFAFYELYEGTSATAPTVGAAATFKTQADQLSRTGLPAGAKRYYWIRAVDRSGNKSAWSASIEATTFGIQATDLEGLEVPNFSIVDAFGNAVFGGDGRIGPTAYVDLSGNNVLLSTVAANSLIPSIHFVGTFATAPTEASLGDDWVQNAVYKNSTDGKSYILTGSPLAWQLYLESGTNFQLTIESSNGQIFRVGQAQNTTLSARLFKNGAEVTEVTPANWFRWRRVSIIPQSPPNDDATWNSLYATGYKQVNINVDAVNARATFFADIIS